MSSLHFNEHLPNDSLRATSEFETPFWIILCSRKKHEFSVFRTGVNCSLRNSKREIRRTEIVVRTDDILPCGLENDLFKSVENSSHLNAETHSLIFADQTNVSALVAHSNKLQLVKLNHG